MALEKAKSRSDSSPPSDAIGRSRDSSPLGVSLRTDLESGIPPARTTFDSEEAATVFDHELTLDDGVERMDSALASVTRSEANLSLLVRGLQHLAASADAARSANDELINQLEALRTQLQQSHEDEQALRFRMAQLEQLLEIVRHESARERRFLIEQQDLFLVEIMSDHERQLLELQRSARAVSETREASAIAELTLQRDQAREYAIRCEQERDLAWRELANGSGPTSVAPDTLRRATPPPLPAPSEPDRTGSGTAIAAINLRSVHVASEASPPTRRPSELAASRYSLPGESSSGEDSGH